MGGLRIALAWLLAAATGAALAQEGARFPVKDFRVEGPQPLSEATVRAVLAPYVRPDATIEDLQRAAAALEGEFKARGYAFLRVVLPPQDTGGEVTLRVLAFRLGSVKFTGQQHFGEANLRASLPALRVGETPNLREIARSQALANDHPRKNVSVTMHQGAKPDTVDAEVAVRDASPRRVFASLANTGSRETGWWRVSVGAQHANLFDRDHSVTASYTTSPGHAGDVKQYGVFYVAPFYRVGGALSAYHSYSDVNSGTIANVFQVSGRGRFSGLRWKQHLQPAGAYAHTLEAGVEDRHFLNDVAFFGTPIGANVRSRPLTLAYTGRYEYAGGQWRGALELATNLGGGRDNSDAAYTANRAGADRRWQAWRASFDIRQAFGDWTGSVRIHGQAAREPLIPGEQFGFGGAAGVRGLRERELSGDSGAAVSFELLTPQLAEGLRALVFLDAGQARQRATATVPASRTGSSSAGAGLRWSPFRGAALSLDYAHVLNAAAVTPRGEDKLHFSLAIEF